MPYRRKNKGINTRFYRTYGFTRAYWNKLKAGNPKLRLKKPAGRSRSLRRQRYTPKFKIYKTVSTRPPMMKLEPWRCRVNHDVNLLMPFTPFVMGAYTTDSASSPADECKTHLYINSHKDPDLQPRSQPLPTNVRRMYAMYKKSRVYGAKITVYFEGVSNNENDKFLAVCYRQPSNEQNPDDDPLAGYYTSATAVGHALQSTDFISKRLIQGTGQIGQSAGQHVWNIGYVSCSKLEMESLGNMEDEDYSGEWQADGTYTVPDKLVGLRFRLLSLRSSGFVDTTQIIMRVKIRMYAQWWDRRQGRFAIGDSDP